jgi:hypothetical protein
MAAFTVIDHTELTGATSSWSEASISSSYDHLMIKASVRADGTGFALYYDQLKLRFNNVSATEYTLTQLYADSATSLTGRNTGSNGMNVAFSNGSLSDADCFASITYWIPHYANSSNFKSVISQCVVSSATTTDNRWFMGVFAGLWSNTDAIDRVDLFSSNGNDLVQYSTFTLYGVTGA